MRSILTSLLGTTCALLLAACGGGGGGGGAPAGNPQPQDLTAYYVSATSGSDANSGAQGSPLKTITAALALVTTGDTVYVAPGTYDAALGEAFPLMVPPNVTLEGDVANRGDGAVPTLVSGHAPIAPGDVHLAALLPGDGAVLRGLKVQAGATTPNLYGIWIQDATVEMHDCTLPLPSYAGLWITGSGASDIHDNTIGGFDYGAYVAGVSGAVHVHDNQFHDSYFTLYLAGSDLSVVEGNTFVSGENPGLTLEGSEALVTGNTFSSWIWNYGGISVVNGSPVIRDNTFQCTQGIFIFGGTPDLGTAADPGLNGFSACTMRGLRHNAATTIQAQGNTWKLAIPAADTDILVDNGGTVFYGPGAADKLP